MMEHVRSVLMDVSVAQVIKTVHVVAMAGEDVLSFTNVCIV